MAFGPKPRAYTVKVNRKARRRALRAALTVHAERGSIAGVDASASTSPPPSRPPRRWPASARERSAVLADGEETCAKFRNIAGASVIHVEDVGVADVIGAARLVLSEAAHARLVEKAVAR